MSYISYYNQQEHLTRTRKTKKIGQNGKTEENRKKTEKTNPKFEICGSVRFFGLQLPQWVQNRGSIRAIGDKLGLCDGQRGLNRGSVRASGSK